jgi:predicted phage terminase large subunit-like protein
MAQFNDPKCNDAIIRYSPGFFLEWLLPQIENLSDYEANWHVHAMSEKLTGLYQGHVRRLIVNAPPRSLKTSTCTSFFIPWLLGKDPSLQIMLVTYSDEFAEQLGSQIRSVMRHPEYKRLFDDTQLVNEKARSTRLRTMKGGKVTITSFHATMTGLGADYIIVDDPIQTNDVRSATKMNDTINRFKEGLYTRLNDPKAGRILLVMQRIHPDDLTGELLERSEFDHLKLPAQFNEDLCYQMPFEQVHVAKAGDYLDPTRFGELELARTRKMLGEAAFAAQYMQEPIYPQNDLVDFEKFKWFEPQELEADLRDAIHVHSWDTAFSTKDSADYTAVTKWAYNRTGYYLLDAHRLKATSEDVENHILREAIAENPNRVIIERANHSVDLIQRVRKSSQSTFQVIEGTHDSLSKENRFVRIQHKINTGQVYLAKGVAGIDLFLSELRGFPYGAHDDLVDSFTMALHVMGKGPGKAVWHIS